MFVAFDTRSEKAISATEMASGVHSDGSADMSERRSYQCLLCGDDMTYNGDTAVNLVETFEHANGADCIDDGNVSLAHRLGQEVVAKELVNWIPTQKPIQLGVERRIGTGSDFLITDIRVSAPVRIAVEIVYLSPVNLRRRLQTMFAEGYAGMFVVVSNGSVSAARVEYHLRKLAPLRIGRFDPRTFEVSFGSVVTPELVDTDSPIWDIIPSYLS